MKDNLKDILPDIEAVKKLLDNFVEQFHTEVEGNMKQINGSVSRVPRKISVSGDVYSFTTLKAALVYGTVLVFTFFGSWLIYTYYRDQAQETVIYQQAQELNKERNCYYNQIQKYRKRKSNIFPFIPRPQSKINHS